MQIEKRHITCGIKNCRGSRLLKGCSPHQLSGNLTVNCAQSATFHTADRWQQAKQTDTAYGYR